jgi:hypothetical protein
MVRFYDLYVMEIDPSLTFNNAAMMLYNSSEEMGYPYVNIDG